MTIKKDLIVKYQSKSLVPYIEKENKEWFWRRWFKKKIEPYNFEKNWKIIQIATYRRTNSGSNTTAVVYQSLFDGKIYRKDFYDMGTLELSVIKHWIKYNGRKGDKNDF